MGGGGAGAGVVDVAFGTVGGVVEVAVMGVTEERRVRAAATEAEPTVSASHW